MSNKQKNFYVILHQEIERDGHVVISTEVLEKLYMSQDEARRAIIQETGGVKNGLWWSDSYKTYAEIPCGNKYYDSYSIQTVKSKWCLETY